MAIVSDIQEGGGEGPGGEVTADEAADRERVRLVLWQSDEPDEETGEYKTIEVVYHLAKIVRQHQREGIQFVFNCVMGLGGFDGQGCILADDMGLGKTLQSICLLYTLLKQGMDGTPTVKKGIIVCPTSLVKNWSNELDKWLRTLGGVKHVALTDSTKDSCISGITDWLRPMSGPILIISYESFRIHLDRFAGAKCDILICDEAHRLKNSETATTKALASLECRRRILLSGTPMQNDLGEFYSMVNFTNPGILGTASEFNRKYQSAILVGREPDATDSETKRGEERSEELSAIVNQFILRRTNELLAAHLPPKVTQIVVCKLTEMQKKLYHHFLMSKAAREVLNGGRKTGVLPAITSLKKLCNHPGLILDLVRQAKAAGKKETTGFDGSDAIFAQYYNQSNARKVNPEFSGKFEIADRLLATLRYTTKDRIVIVSNYTQTLDMFQRLCTERMWPCIKLDGSTGANKRQVMVDKFNDLTNNEFVFLLSSKAGGCGLNLIGGNRLILFDPDWNPANDKQAAARVWRDGQKKRVYLYRFLTQGTIEEKIYQRQISKEGLQTIVVDNSTEANAISSSELAELFTLHEDTASNTHDILCCERCGENDETGKTFQTQVGKPEESDLNNWAHHHGVDNLNHDTVLKSVGKENVSFIFSLETDYMEVPLEAEQEVEHGKVRNRGSGRRKKGAADADEGGGESDGGEIVVNEDDEGITIISSDDENAVVKPTKAVKSKAPPKTVATKSVAKADPAEPVLSPITTAAHGDMMISHKPLTDITALFDSPKTNRRGSSRKKQKCVSCDTVHTTRWYPLPFEEGASISPGTTGSLCDLCFRQMGGFDKSKKSNTKAANTSTSKASLMNDTGSKSTAINFVADVSSDEDTNQPSFANETKIVDKMNIDIYANDSQDFADVRKGAISLPTKKAAGPKDTKPSLRAAGATHLGGSGGAPVTQGSAEVIVISDDDTPPKAKRARKPNYVDDSEDDDA